VLKRLTAHPPKTELISTPPAGLKVGMYVDLNCSWFQHPFARKSFKLRSAQEIATIQGLGLTSVLVDPSLSDCEETDHWTTEVAGGQSPVLPPADVATPLVAPVSDDALAHPTMTKYKEGLQQANRQYKQTLAQGSQALTDITNGSETGLATAKEMVNVLNDLILDESTSSAMSILLGAQDLQDVSVLHAMNVAVISMLVGRQFDLDQEQLKLLGIAGLLHDIGEQHLPAHLLKTRRDGLTAEDQLIFRQHVDFGIDMLRQFPGLPDTVPDMIQQHHERIDGSGYPAKLKGNQLSLPARILMVVDEYDRLINAPTIHDNLPPTEALSQLYLTSKTKFSEEVVVALIQILSVYPPGTVVELSDKSVGLVISINLRARMRPIVILYSPTADQDNPDIADLAQDSSRSITRSLPKTELTRDMLEYLNLTRWTGYFINSSRDTLKDAEAAGA
jgi:putative nucleotidyltransferase with HDIG domain